MLISCCTFLLRLLPLLLILLPQLISATPKGEQTKQPPRHYRQPKGRRENFDFRQQHQTDAEIERIYIATNYTNDNSATVIHDRELDDEGSTSDVFVTVQILFDRYPSDITWNITTEFGGGVIASASNFDDTNFQFKEVIQSVPVNLGSNYSFNIFDAYGDGIHNGYFAVFFGNDTTNIDNLLVYWDNFKVARDIVPFTAKQPSTLAPTPAQPTISPHPTHSPSSCQEGERLTIKVDPFTSKPVIKSAKDTFATNMLCTSHTNYLDCTNESQEDCQWIFLTSSQTKGMCRIDPISKCLETGKCVCYTHDFHGGRADYAGGIVFHAPISITARDISQYSHQMSYHELYSTPTDNANSKHRHDDNFFISKVDFTSRFLIYNFSTSSPMYNDIGSNHTIAFKLHFLYMDVPLVGTILNGLGMLVSIDTSNSNQHVITINQQPYILTKALKMWTCTSIVISPTTLYVAGNALARNLDDEVISQSNTHELILGSFPGELFDVRVYSGILTFTQIREVGAKCASPNDPAALKVSRDIDVFYDRNGCDSGIRKYVTEPTTGGQTYGSGPFATLWVAPKEHPFQKGIFFDIYEGKLDKKHVTLQTVLDEEYFFQHKKIQTYLWEKYYFENDMIAFPMEPYRYVKNSSQVAEFAESVWNNPCRYMHQNNNLWDFPLYNTDKVPKWVAPSPNEVFDLRDMFFKHGGDGYQYVAHEMFHEFQQTLYYTHGQGIGWLLSESGASFGPAYTFPGTNVLYASLPLAISYPFGYEMNAESAFANAHFLSPELSFNENIRVGHIYNSWVMWWFLAEHANMPFLSGQMNSNDRYTSVYNNGVLSMVRLFVEAEGMDLGDVWGIFVAHYRTWDFKMGEEFADAESADFENTKLVLPAGTTLENRKTTVHVDAISGTNNSWIAGPSELRPGPFGWNCLTMDSVAANRFVVIDIAWEEGMGFQPRTNPPDLPTRQRGCDNDARFYNSMVVSHSLSTGERRYWKLKGKTPQALVINTMSNGPVNIYILLIPTPPTDYPGGRHFASNTLMYPIPIYNYTYNIQVLSSMPLQSVARPAEPKRNGIVTFKSTAATAFWPVRCTCIDNPESKGNFCIDPIFPGKSQISSAPTRVPTSKPSTSKPSTRAPTSKPSTSKPSTRAPTFKPSTSKPTTRAPTFKPSTSKPSTRDPTSKPSTLKPTTLAPTFTLKPTMAPKKDKTKSPKTS